MTQLLKNEPIAKDVSNQSSVPVLAANKIFAGSMVGLQESTGFGRQLVAGDLFMGHASRKADNTASGAADGDIDVIVESGVYKLEVPITGVTVLEIGLPVYASDGNAYTLTATANSPVGRVAKFVSSAKAIVEFESLVLIDSYTPELDVETGEDSADHLLVPGFKNPKGLFFRAAYGQITEVMAGSSQDQGIITISDESNNSLATLTAADAAADAADDIIVGYSVGAASSGDAGKFVAAGEFIDCAVTQVTAGGTPAGKMRVFVVVQPLR